MQNHQTRATQGYLFRANFTVVAGDEIYNQGSEPHAERFDEMTQSLRSTQKSETETLIRLNLNYPKQRVTGGSYV
jgi:hypothetical protein